MEAVTRTRRPDAPGPTTSLVGRTAVLVAVALAVLVGTSTRPSPDLVDRVVVRNEGDHLLSVAVASARGGGELSLGAVEPGTTEVFDQVLDLGPRWRVTLASGGVDAGDYDVARTELVEGWTVPDAVDERLDRAGLPPVTGADELRGNPAAPR